MQSANAASAGSPKRPSSLQQRVTSSVVLVLVVLIVVWWNFWSLVIGLAIVAVVAISELYSAFQRGGYPMQRWLGIPLTLVPILAAVGEAYWHRSLIAPVCSIGIVVSLIAQLPWHTQTGMLARWGLSVAGAYYVGLLISVYVLLRALDTPLGASPLRQLGPDPGAAWIFFVLLATWGQDVLAYFAGRLFGRHLMTPTLSPKKTWEGAAGGVLGSIVAAWFGVYLFGLPLAPLWIIIIGTIAGVVGPLGDLSESMIKRQAGIKDAGDLIPGHGGMLDRIDSMLFTGPVIGYLLLLLLPFMI